MSRMDETLDSKRPDALVRLSREDVKALVRAKAKAYVTTVGPFRYYLTSDDMVELFEAGLDFFGSHFSDLLDEPSESPNSFFTSGGRFVSDEAAADFARDGYVRIDVAEIKRNWADRTVTGARALSFLHAD